MNENQSIGEGPQKPISPIRPDAVARELHSISHGVTKGPDFAPEKTPEQIQAFLRQRQSDWDFEDNEERIEFETERLNQLLRQEKVITDEQPERYEEIASYVAYGKIPTDEKFAASLANIVKRDSAGEWEDSYTVGEPIPKKNPQR